MPPPIHHPSKSALLTFAAFSLILLAAAWLRFPHLELRPMHTDEAVQAVKLVDTVNAGVFDYDPHDYHGPGLIFSTIALRAATGQPPSENLTATSLRIVPALYGILLIASLALFLDGLGRTATVAAATLLAFSPIFVYYSRYFIMELPLVAFTSLFIGCGWRYFRSQKLAWALASGTAAGLMHVAKETAAISWLATAFGLAFAAALHFRSQSSRASSPFTIRPSHFLAAVAAGLLVSATLFSSFFQDTTAIIESFRTYFNYAERAGGSGHEKPWHAYLSLLTYKKDVFVWSEAPIVALGIFGIVSAFRSPSSTGRPALTRFLAIYTVSAFAIYSAIPYKTPWSILPAYFGLVLLAGSGAVAAFRLIPKPSIAIPIAAAASAATLWWFHSQNSLANGRFAADTRNPYVYAHTSGDLVKLADRILALSEFQKGTAMPVKVYAAPDAGWPLPWYLRDLTHVGYWPDLPTSKPDGSVFIVAAEKADALSALLTTDFHRSLYGFRPGTENQAILFVESTLWNQFMKSRQ